MTAREESMKIFLPFYVFTNQTQIYEERKSFPTSTSAKNGVFSTLSNRC